MKSGRRAPPSSSYSRSKSNSILNVEELASRISLNHVDNSSRASLSSSSSHISSLPPEILMLIFEYCVPQEQFPIPSSTEAPLLLTHVSSHWRTLAISFPELWTAFHINYKDPTEDISFTNTYLSRSGDKPLALSIAIDFAEQPQQQILDALCKYSKRWRHICFDFRHLLCPPMYSLGHALNNVSELSTFEFHARDISAINISPITRLLSCAPALREISWVDDMADIDTVLKLPLAQLTRLSLSMDHGTLDYLQVLKECNNLEHFRVTRSLSPILQPQTPLFLSKLTSLNISSNIIGILDTLVLPALQEVRIYGENHKQGPTHEAAYQTTHHQTHLPAQLSTATLYTPEPVGSWDSTALLSLIDRSGCAITSLSVSPPMTERMLLICLRRMSNSLSKLSIEGLVVGDALLEELTYRPSLKEMKTLDIVLEDGHRDLAIAAGLEGLEIYDILCPKLEEIFLDARVGCKQGILASMVESRVSLPMHPSQTSSDKNNGTGGLHVDGAHYSGEYPVLPLRKMRTIDGQKDLERLQELSLISRTWATMNAINSNIKTSSSEGSLKTTSFAMDRPGDFRVDVIPRKHTNARTRNFFFRRKLCASR